MSRRKQNAAANGSYRARVRRDKRVEVRDARVQAVLDDLAISASGLLIARMAARRRKVKP